MLDISVKVRDITRSVELELREQFERIDAIAAKNTERVLAAFRNNRVSDTYFAGTSGYGYDDRGREMLDRIYAEVFGAEAGLVRLGFVNGTHAIGSALFGATRPGTGLISLTGAPYDTLRGVIGISEKGHGSLADYGVGYSEIALTSGGLPDYDAIRAALGDGGEVSAVLIQRSRGYSERPALSCAECGRLAELAHELLPGVNVVVDNCYGEFVEEAEPTALGADLAAGSLIKNPGGGLAPAGGYIVGRADLVEAASYRLTVPGIGGECGPTLGQSRLLYQGLFMAPHTVAQALKTACLCAGVLERLGYETAPSAFELRRDIIQMIRFGEPEALKAFCRGIQKGAPVDSFVTPEPWAMPGYDCEVIMAAGAFVQGSSIELSADGPLRPPYAAYMQGGLTYESGRLGIMMAVDEILRR